MNYIFLQNTVLFLALVAAFAFQGTAHIYAQNSEANTLVVGAPYTSNDNYKSGEGAVYIFETDSSGVWRQTLKISDNGGDGTNGELGVALDPHDRFGISSSIDGNTLVVGTKDYLRGSEPGAVYIFDRNSSGIWSQTLKISDNGGDGTNGELGVVLDHYAYFGSSSAINGDTLVVGSEGYADKAGAAYIFERDSSGVWSQTLKISDNGGDGTNGELGVDLDGRDKFGSSSSIDGNTLVVGAHGDADGGARSEAVYIFEKDSSGAWSETLKISDNGGDGTNGELGVTLNERDQFGSSSSIDGNTLVVGARGNDDGGPGRGAVYIFDKDSSGEWSKTLKISDNGGDGTDGELGIDLDKGDYFGESSAIEGNTLVVGAHGDADGGTWSGAVYIFEKDSSGTWSKTLKISDNGGDGTNGELGVEINRRDSFGTSTSLAVIEKPKSYSDPTAFAVGAPHNDDGGPSRGAVYIFEGDSSGIITETLKIYHNNEAHSGELHIDLDDNDWFGYSSSIFKNTLVVGAFNDDGDNDSNAGAVYIFEKDSSGTWSETLKISDNGGDGTNGELGIDLGSGDNFGSSVSFDGSSIVVGASGDDEGGSYSGAVYIFEKDLSGEWGQTLKISEDGGDGTSTTGTLGVDLAEYSYFGRSVSKNDGALAVGVFGDNNVGSYSGAVYIFEKDALGTWSKTLNISDNDGEVANGELTVDLGEYSYFGHAVDMEEHALVISAYNEKDKTNGKGAVYVFEKDASGTWEQAFTISDNGGDGTKVSGKLGVALEDNDWFGFSVSTLDNTLMVGAARDGDGGDTKGAVYIFDKDSSGVWGQTLKISDNGGDGTNGELGVELGNGDYFGASVSFVKAKNFIFFTPRYSIALAENDDTGTVGDGVTTNKDNLTFYGTSAPGARVELLYHKLGVWVQAGLTPSVPFATVDANGDWSITVSFSEDAAASVIQVGIRTELLDGTYETPWGFTDTPSAMDLEINYTAPSKYFIALAENDDTGTVGDGVTTNKDELTFSGRSVPNATVELFYKNSDAWTKYQMTPSPATTTADEDGNWEITVSFSQAAAENVKAIAFRTTQTNGTITDTFFDDDVNQPRTGSMLLTINYTAPSKYSIALAENDDTGVKGDGITTRIDDLTFEGRSIANATVELFYKNSDAWTKYQMTPSPATTTADEDGNWEITVSFSQAAAENVKAIAFRTTQTNGTITDTFFDDDVNQPRTGSMLLTINYPAPFEYSIALAGEDDTGQIGDGVTEKKDNLSFYGKRSFAEAEVELFYYDGNVWTQRGLTPSSPTGITQDGAWIIDDVSFTESAAENVTRVGIITKQADGTFEYPFPKNSSSSMDLVINYTAPSYSIALAADDDTGTVGDGVTENKDDLTFNGTSAPDTTVEFLYHNGNNWTVSGLTPSIPTATVDTNGDWSMDVSFSQAAAENVTRVGIRTKKKGNVIIELPYSTNSPSSMDLTIDYTVVAE